jgi:AcrR family transcriptional regulator
MKSSRRRVILAEVVRELPRRAHDLSHKAVRDSQRWRLLEAVTEVIAKVGYAEMSVADVIAAAKVSRKTFYEHYRDKEDCFLAAYDFLSDQFIANLVRVGEQHRIGAARRRAQVTAFLATLAREPEIARAFMVDVMGAGERALQRREAVNARFASTILGRAIDATILQAIVGGVNAVCASYLIADRGHELPKVTETLVRFLEHGLMAGRRRR